MNVFWCFTGRTGVCCAAMREQDNNGEDQRPTNNVDTMAGTTPLRVCVVGMGRVGLPLAITLALQGNAVHGVDSDPQMIHDWSTGRRAWECEPGLTDAVERVRSSGALSVTAAPLAADAFVVAVPTPVDEHHQANLNHVDAAMKALTPVLEPGNLVVLESTVPVGTTDRVAALLRRMRPDLDGPSRLYVAHCPERVLPGHVLAELKDNDRVVGGVDPESTARAMALYRRFVRGRLFGTDARSAEIVKLVENAYRDVNIAFANEVSMICDALGIDAREVIALANRHPRVSILSPGPGVGGHCVPVDPWFLAAAAPHVTSLIPAARGVNEAKTRWVVRRVLDEARKFAAPTVACLGLTYKADLDDVRESPALAIARELGATEGVRVLVADPHVRAADGLTLLRAEDAIARADVVVALVAHSAFHALPPDAFAGKTFVDVCGLRR